MLTALADSFALCCLSAQPAAAHRLTQGGTLQEGSPENLPVFQAVCHQIRDAAQDCRGKAAGSVWSSGKAKWRLHCSQGLRENIKHSMPNRPSFQISLTALFALFRQNKELKCYKASAALGPRRPPPVNRGHLSCARAEGKRRQNRLQIPLCSFQSASSSYPNRNSLLWLVHK